MSVQQKRKRLQSIIWIGLPLVIAAGLFYPGAGFALFICMLGAVGLSFTRGRYWCDWMCPRGAFLELFFNRLSRKIKIPAVLKGNAVRIAMLGVIFTAIGVQFYLAWGNAGAMGMALLRVLIITTLAGILMALFIHPRAWCQICPMGTVAGWIGKKRMPLHISNNCKKCGICAGACPMQINPAEHKDTGRIQDGDCLKCGTCTSCCPVNALSFNAPSNKENSQDNQAA